MYQSSLAADTANILDDGADAAITSSAGGQVAASAKIIDLEALGIDYTTSPMLAAEVNVEAISASGTYKLAIQNGNSNLSTVTAETNMFITETGNYLFQFRPMNRYVRVYYTLAGGGVSLTKGKAFLALIPQ